MMKNLLLFTIMSLFLTVTTMAQRVADIKIEPYTFVTNKGQKVEAELGRIYVPERRATPIGKLIELAFVRFKSTAHTPSSPIVYLAGGPGGSGIALAKGARFALFMAMREIGDVVALDQRGTGLSKLNFDLTRKSRSRSIKPRQDGSAALVSRAIKNLCGLLATARR
jgi:pimeloyl-ACP methyl ester carboxylesterase